MDQAFLFYDAQESGFYPTHKLKALIATEAEYTTKIIANIVAHDS